MKNKLIYIIIIFTLSCTSQKNINCSDLEFVISRKLFKAKKFKKYTHHIQYFNNSAVDSVGYFFVESYKKRNKWIEFSALKYKDEIYINLYKFNGAILDTVQYNQFNDSLLKFDLMNNETIDMYLRKLRRGIYKGDIYKRSYYYKP